MSVDKVIRSFEDLEVFQRAYRISLDIHRASLDFPKIEQYALADQVRRASKAICANLAEGFAKQRRSSAEYRRFLQMAIGSADEIASGCAIVSISATSTSRHGPGGATSISRSRAC
jgi:four helix bundle protein